MSFDPNWTNQITWSGTATQSQYWWGQPQTITAGTPTVVYPPQEARRTSKELRITPSLKGFKVAYTDAHGSVKESEYTKDELTTALPDLLAKLTKEPKEE